jgi:hypothetical protein
MQSKLLIRDDFSEFNFNSKQEREKNEQENEQEKNILNKINYLYFSDNYSNELIEEIDDKNYNLYDHEIKYKIFEDISSITKKNNVLELILNIPVDDNIISINKIKFSNKLNKYIKDIYVCVGNEKVITYTDFINKNIFQTIPIPFTQQISTEKIINCQFNKDITLHILLKNNIINKIINKNIFVNYSFAIFKNKLKFI